MWLIYSSNFGFVRKTMINERIQKYVNDHSFCSEYSRVKSVRPCRKRLQVYSRKLTTVWIGCPASSKRTAIPMFKRSNGCMTTPRSLWNNTTVIWPHGSGRSTESSNPSRHRLKKRASERSFGIWKRRPSAGTTQGGNRHDLAATIMTEDAKTEKHTAGAPAVHT